MIPTAGSTNIGLSYFMADGKGTLTNFGIFNLATPPGYYSVSNTGGVLLTIDSLLDGTNSLTGQFMPARQIVFTGSSTNVAANTLAIGDTTLCAGNWSGDLVETSDPDGLKDYSVILTVATNGSAVFSSPALSTGTGWIFALAPTNGALSAFIKTGLGPANHYNQIQVNGTLNGNTISGSFNTDSGQGADAVEGVVTLTRQ